MNSILINAYACAPDKGSEPGMAWNWIVRLARYNRLYVITEGEWRREIEEALQALPQKENIRFYYNPVPEKVRRMCWNQGDWRFYYYYRRWQQKTLEIAREIVGRHPIDAIHQLNMVGFREPGYLWKIEGIPFVWGPIAGIGTIPTAYLKGAGLKSLLFFHVKKWITQLQLRYSPRVAGALKKADCVFAATPETGRAVERCHGIKTLPINETGCRDEPSQAPEPKMEGFNLLWVGRFIYTKQLNLALEAMARLKHRPDIRLHIVGRAFSEADTEAAKNRAKKLGIDSQCVWYGQIPNREVLSLMRRSDLFFFTSIFEATSTVVLEALESRLPVLCFDACGFGPLIDQTVGAKIPFTTPDDSVRAFADRIEYFHRHRELLAEMAEACEKKRECLTWDRKARQITACYDTLKKPKQDGL